MKKLFVLTKVMLFAFILQFSFVPAVQADPIDSVAVVIPEGVDSATYVAFTELVDGIGGNIGDVGALIKSLPNTVDSLGAFSLWDTLIFAFLMWALTLLGSRFEWVRKMKPYTRAIAFGITIALGYSGLVYDMQLTIAQLFQYILGYGIASNAIYPIFRALFNLVSKKGTAPQPAT